MIFSEKEELQGIGVGGGGGGWGCWWAGKLLHLIPHNFLWVSAMSKYDDRTICILKEEEKEVMLSCLSEKL